jgi:hypothetical protein
MNAKFNFYNGNVQQTQRPVESVQEARGLAKKTLRRLGSVPPGQACLLTACASPSASVTVSGR